MTKNNKNRGAFTKNIRGQAYIGVPSNTSAVGASVVTRYEIDTSLCAVWAQFGNLFQQWRIKDLQFHFSRIQGIDVPGSCVMAVIEDPDSSSPVTLSDALDQRVSKLFTYGNAKERVTLMYRPVGRSSKWLYTKDNVTNDDRLEMPCDFIFLSRDFTASVSPGLLSVTYEIEFTGLTNSVIASPSPTSIKENSSETEAKARIKQQLQTLMHEYKKLDQGNSSSIPY